MDTSPAWYSTSVSLDEPRELVAEVVSVVLVVESGDWARKRVDALLVKERVDGAATRTRSLMNKAFNSRTCVFPDASLGMASTKQTSASHLYCDCENAGVQQMVS